MLMSSFVAEKKKELGSEAFMLSPGSTAAGSTMFFSSQVKAMLAVMAFFSAEEIVLSNEPSMVYLKG